MADPLSRLTVGFDGGQALPLKLKKKDADALIKQFASGETGIHEVPTEDGAVVLRLEQIVFVRTDSDVPRVGFAAS